MAQLGSRADRAWSSTGEGAAEDGDPCCPNFWCKPVTRPAPAKPFMVTEDHVDSCRSIPMNPRRRRWRRRCPTQRRHLRRRASDQSSSMRARASSNSAKLAGAPPLARMPAFRPADHHCRAVVQRHDREGRPDRPRRRSVLSARQPRLCSAAGLARWRPGSEWMVAGQGAGCLPGRAGRRKDWIVPRWWGAR